MSNNYTKALFDAYRLTISSMQAHGAALIAEKVAANREKFRISGDKVMVIYHRRSLSRKQFAALNQRQRDCEKVLADNQVKMIELGREIASFSMVVDANTTADERTAEFALKRGTFDHGIASMSHLIFCGACKPAGDGDNFDVIRHALILACRDYSDNLTGGPDVAAIEHVASENAIDWFIESNGSHSSDDDGELVGGDELADGDELEYDEIACSADSIERFCSSVVFEGVTFGCRDCFADTQFNLTEEEDATGKYPTGTYALPLREYSNNELIDLTI